MKTSSARRGKNTLVVDVGEVRADGMTIRVDGRDLTISFAKFPWFLDVAPSELRDVERPSPDHLHWPALDVDLSIDSIEHPERYPLVSRAPAMVAEPRAAQVAKKGVRRATGRR